MGYGGGRDEAAFHTGGRGDGGVDGAFIRTRSASIPSSPGQMLRPRHRHRTREDTSLQRSLRRQGSDPRRLHHYREVQRRRRKIRSCRVEANRLNRWRKARRRTPWWVSAWERKSNRRSRLRSWTRISLKTEVGFRCAEPLLRQAKRRSNREIVGQRRRRGLVGGTCGRRARSPYSTVTDFARFRG